MGHEEVEAVIKRFHEVLFLRRDAQTRDEDLLLKTYHDAIMEMNLFDSYLSIEEPENDFTIIDLLAIIVGYSLGQKACEHEINEGHLN